MRLSFAWWNTSLSPLGKPRADQRQMEIALEVVKHLAVVLQVDCLALGEVTVEELKRFQAHLQMHDYSVFDGTLKKERLQFDTGVLYRNTKLQLINHRNLIISKGKRSFKLANKIDFLVPQTEKPFHLFVSHWPSRLWCAKDAPDRHFLGDRLRLAIEQSCLDENDPVYIILLGDYNDEPYDSSLAEQILAVRDRNLVRRNPTLMYNPFWRHLGEAIPYIPGNTCQSFCGSCYYSSSADSSWRTFDQIIFSSAFLGRSNWHLNEEYTKILDLPYLRSGKKDIFDHLPVMSVIDWRSM